ncbi:PRC-barrel domain-containing protein [Solwaraspora sp. WMMD406]|uniref:PRC-barrel domain-containing protein n=1 Tax=Solwaraspora sp. WMMD406 TaxID=3016095 RepID=UPI002417A675|nr:PRC-barrel domain-containing protein [Solwaraspora sp. WMMD406]MDG4767281.1 PRC-barrel domain-containing protein [Solwaraspora sp. WMMD406]
MDRLDPQTTPAQATDPMPYDGQDTVAGGTPAGAFDPWRYRDDAGVDGANLVGYKVEATDGGIGKIDAASDDVQTHYLVVDTGPWIFGKKVLLPAGVVNHVDHDEEKVYVDRSKDQIKEAPEYDETHGSEPGYHDKLGSYYAGTYGGAPVPPIAPGRLL